MNKLHLVVIFILLFANLAVANAATLPKTKDPQIFKYEHIFPPTKEPQQLEKQCTGLDALDPECLNIEIQKEAEQQQDKKK